MHTSLPEGQPEPGLCHQPQAVQGKLALCVPGQIAPAHQRKQLKGRGEIVHSHRQKRHAAAEIR